MLVFSHEANGFPRQRGLNFRDADSEESKNSKTQPTFQIKEQKVSAFADLIISHLRLNGVNFEIRS